MPRIEKHGFLSVTSVDNSGNKFLILQSCLSVRSLLGMVKLMSDLSKNTKWRVRDLFQRDVDYDRVKNGLKQYIEDTNTVTFLGPLTLALLPKDAFNCDQQSISFTSKTDHVNQIYSQSVNDNEALQITCTYDQDKDQNPAILVFETDTYDCIPVDGQHRFAALKMLSEQRSDIHNWQIPVTFVSIHNDTFRQPDFTAMLRHIFVSINTKAVSPTRTRQILLEEFFPKEVVVQSFLQCLLDQQELQERLYFPLWLTEWRGKTQDGNEVRNELALFSAIDVFNWMTDYFPLNSNPRKSAIRASKDLRAYIDLPEPLAIKVVESLRKSTNLTTNEANALREACLPLVQGLVTILNGFTPYKDCLLNLQTIISRCQNDPRTRFQKAIKSLIESSSIHEQESRVNESFNSIKSEMRGAIDNIPQFIVSSSNTGTIGFGAVIYAFSKIWDITKQAYPAHDWGKFSENFLDCLNTLYKVDATWFANNPGVPDDLTEALKLREMLTYTSYGTVGNLYQKSLRTKGFGSLITLLLLKLMHKTFYDKVKEGYLKTIKEVIQTGYKKQLTDNYRNQYNVGKEEAERQTSDELKKRVDKQMNSITSYLRDLAA